MTYAVEMKPPAPNMPMNNQQAVLTGNGIHPYHAMMMMSRQQQQQMMNMNRR
jgi:hypothetical protein